MNFEIDKKQIEIFYNETENKKIPVIILNTFRFKSLLNISVRPLGSLTHLIPYLFNFSKVNSSCLYLFNNFIFITFFIATFLFLYS